MNRMVLFHLLGCAFGLTLLVVNVVMKNPPTGAYASIGLFLWSALFAIIHYRK